MAMCDSAFRSAAGPAAVEVRAYVDDDDRSGYERILYPGHGRRVVVKRGPRLTHSDYWNTLAKTADGDIFMLAGDDLRFETPGWDLVVEEEFERWPDRIVLVHGDDGGDHDQTVGTHPFLHRRWVDTVGYMTPPGFVSDFTDAWLDEVATALGRKVCVPILTEHQHPLWSKGDLDVTHRERLERHARENPGALYAVRSSERVRDVERLRASMC